MDPLNVDMTTARYRALVGVGGIGSGVFFQLTGNRTLGREESRGGRFLDQRDYCKLHIIAHYVRVLLGSGFRCYPIGFVGEDEAGFRLLKEMSETGFDLAHVRALPGEQTLFSTCFIYPDGTGGNMTTEDSANSKVGPKDVMPAEAQFAAFDGRGIALAAPEVSLETRLALLERATAHRFLRAAALTTEETNAALAHEILARTDLLALNLEEAAALCGMEPASGEAEAIVQAAVKKAAEIQPEIRLSVTAGKRGSWSWDGDGLYFYPGIAVAVAGTAGAGDAHFGGLLAGTAAGLPLREAQVLATLVAALSVTSPHTIHPGIGRDTLERFASERGINLPESVWHLLRTPAHPG